MTESPFEQTTDSAVPQPPSPDASEFDDSVRDSDDAVSTDGTRDSDTADAARADGTGVTDTEENDAVAADLDSEDALSDSAPGTSSDSPESAASTHSHPDEANVPAPPETGDLVVDAALRELAATSGDVDAQLEAAEQVQRTLHSRLADLNG